MLEPIRGLGFQGFGTSASSNPNRLSKTINSYCGAFLAYVGTRGDWKSATMHISFYFIKNELKKRMQRTKKKLRKKNLTNTRPCLQIESGLCRNFEKIFELGYFRVALSLCLKARLNAKFILVQIKLILVLTRKVSHLASF